VGRGRRGRRRRLSGRRVRAHPGGRGLRLPGDAARALRRPRRVQPLRRHPHRPTWARPSRAGWGWRRARTCPRTAGELGTELARVAGA
jgi:hypothetical protein